MSFTTDLQKSFADHSYKWIKADIPAGSAAMSAEAPIRSGSTKAHTYMFLDAKSNDEVAIIRMRSTPPSTPTYRGHSRKGNRDYGTAHAAFSNARGRSKGWWPRAVAAGAKVFGA